MYRTAKDIVAPGVDKKKIVKSQYVVAKYEIISVSLDETTMALMAVEAQTTAWDNVMIGCRRQKYQYVVFENVFVCYMLRDRSTVCSP